MALNMDRRRLMLWAVLAGSTLYTGSTLLRRPATPPPRNARQAAQPAPAAASARALAPSVPGVEAPAAAGETPAPAVPPLQDEELAAWRATLGRGERDPFFTLAEIDAMNHPSAPRPVTAPPPTPATYTVKLIMMQGNSGRALIDGRVVREGDMLGDERVVQIVPDAVVLERGRERRSLPVAKAAGAAIQLERTR